MNCFLCLQVCFLRFEIRQKTFHTISIILGVFGFFKFLYIGRRYMKNQNENFFGVWNLFILRGGYNTNEKVGRYRTYQTTVVREKYVSPILLFFDCPKYVYLAFPMSLYYIFIKAKHAYWQMNENLSEIRKKFVRIHLSVTKRIDFSIKHNNLSYLYALNLEYP